MHHIYHTKGFIIASANSGEADKVLYFFTEGLGFIRANVQGVREIKSKLRYSLQNYSLTELSMVRAKNGWRITNAALLANYYADFKNERGKFLLVVRIFSLLRRLLHGEEADKELFNCLAGGFHFLREIEVSEIADFEPIFVLRILYRLGYVGTSPALDKFVSSSTWTKDMLAESATARNMMIASINDSLRESHL